MQIQQIHLLKLAVNFNQMKENSWKMQLDTEDWLVS